MSINVFFIASGLVFLVGFMVRDIVMLRALFAFAFALAFAFAFAPLGFGFGFGLAPGFALAAAGAADAFLRGWRYWHSLPIEQHPAAKKEHGGLWK